MKTLLTLIVGASLATAAVLWLPRADPTPDWKYTTLYGHPTRIDPATGNFEILGPQGYISRDEVARRLAATRSQPISRPATSPTTSPAPQPLQWLDPSDPMTIIASPAATANQVRTAHAVDYVAPGKIVRLTTERIIKINQRKITFPAGTACTVLAIQGNQISVALMDSAVILPRSAVEP